LEIITDATVADFETFMTNWLANANSSCVGLEVFACPTTCTPVLPSND
jgi:hypothetical protein